MDTENGYTIFLKLQAAQACLKAPKTQENNFGKYKYRSCEDILEALKPVLNKTGLTLLLSDEIVEIGGRVYVKATATVYDFNGGSVSVSAYAREEESKKGMDSSQVTGASSSYARKYALNGLFCIDDTKDSDATNTHGKEPAETAGRFVCERCGKTLIPYMDKTGKPVSLRAHAEQSQKKFGKLLCIDCIKEGG